TLGTGMVGVVAHLRRQIERARQARLAVLEEIVEAPIGVLGAAEAGVLAHGPEARSVHLLVDAPGVRRMSRSPEARARLEGGQVGFGVDRLDLDPRLGAALLHCFLPAWAPAPRLLRSVGPLPHTGRHCFLPAWAPAPR